MFRSCCHFVSASANLIATLALIGSTLAATAQNTDKNLFITANTTIHSSVKQHIFVGYASSAALRKRAAPTSPTVHIVTGANLSSDINLYSHSRLDVSGGIVKGGLFSGIFGLDDSNIVVSGGSVASIASNNNCKITISGGNIGGITMLEHSSITLLRGKVTLIYALDHNTVNLRVGSCIDFALDPNSTMNVYGTGLRKTLVSTIPDSLRYVLAGKLSDGTILDGTKVDVHNSKSINLINTPAAPK